MRVVIDIPKIEWEWWQENGEIDACVVRDALRNGITLPKGHGRLGDLDAVMSDISASIEAMTNIGIAVDGEYLWAKLNDAIDNAQTIIEADGAEE